MIEFAPKGHRRKTRAGKFGERVQGEAVGVEENDIEDKRGGGDRQWPGNEKLEGTHGGGAGFFD